MEEGVIDSPCTGDCRMEQVLGKARCRSCFRDYDDIEQWFYMSKERRIERMEQLKDEQSKEK